VKAHQFADCLGVLRRQILQVVDGQEVHVIPELEK
jgi:hypothetical protein